MKNHHTGHIGTRNPKDYMDSKKSNGLYRCKIAVDRNEKSSYGLYEYKKPLWSRTEV